MSVEAPDMDQFYLLGDPSSLSSNISPGHPNFNGIVDLAKKTGNSHSE